MSSKIIIALLIILGNLIFQSIHATHCDVEYWQFINVTNWKSKKYRLYTDCEYRFNHDASKFYHLRISECWVYNAFKFLDLEIHYTLAFDKAPNTSIYRNEQRLEFEINPALEISKSWSARWRNRLELIKEEHNSKILSIFRHRFLVQIPLKNWGNLASVTYSNEIFYNININEFVQNRIVPIEMNLKFKKFNLDVFLMIRSLQLEDEWTNNIVVGSRLTF